MLTYVHSLNEENTHTPVIARLDRTIQLYSIVLHAFLNYLKK